eukprot:CAMPEP_0119477416 /NCGR_PEP_ID=MMETSP1344-20130328/7557_1 /TAXON_ID=236787 /ORGANISM="Florenciella parvula, Strain CCMP2471" /LENGTH=159 /DNA_ID=CAMNT_0007511387 /DNA_START=142 /DNA_END=623 /DNA_ORIENTATION=-
MASVATVVIVVALAIAGAAACILRRRRQWLVVGGWCYHSASDGARGEREELRVKANMLVVKLGSGRHFRSAEQSLVLLHVAKSGSSYAGSTTTPWMIDPETAVEWRLIHANAANITSPSGVRRPNIMSHSAACLQGGGGAWRSEAVLADALQAPQGGEP